MSILKIKISRTEIAKIYFAISVLLLSISTSSCSQQIEPSREYQLKSVFLFNLASFVDWPKNSFDTNQDPIIIGILGSDPFGKYLYETIQGEVIMEHPLMIQRYTSVDDITTCHILFINVANGDPFEKILNSLKGKNILTVGDVKDFAKKGGMVGFITEKNKIKIQINTEAVKKTDLIISSKLLRLAEIIVP